MEKKLYDTYVKILEEELVPAMGCTEPIAIAYGAAVARETLGEIPDEVEITASGNIIKNVKSVVVPNTPGHFCRGCGRDPVRKSGEKAGGSCGH